MYDGWNLIRETTTTDSRTSTESYVWGLDLSGSLQGAGGIGGLLVRNTDSGSFLYLYDANGNVGQLVDASTGSIAAHYEYDPFGNTIVANGSEAGSNPFRFSTKSLDTETGLSYYGYRYYSPELGRWISKDPLQELGGINLYIFVGNCPVGYIDYLGLDWLTNLSNFVAGAGDSLTFGLTRQARKGINFLVWGDFEDPSVTTGSKAYIAGEVTEVAIEISLTLGSASLKNIAKHTAREALEEAAARRAFRKAHNLVGGFVHHVNPIKGHPAMRGSAWRYARYPLPFRWASNGFWNMKWIPTRAAHNAAHLRLMRLEALDRLRESTILIRQSINRIMIYLEEEDLCWDSMEVRAQIYGSVTTFSFDENSANTSPLFMEVSEENAKYGVWR